MIYAEVRPDGKILQVWKNIQDKNFNPPILPDSTLISFADNVEVHSGMIWDGIQLYPAPEPPLSFFKESAKKEIISYADQIAQQLVDDYPASERESWAVKLAAAEAYVAGSATQVQQSMIETEANLLGVQPIDLANKIILKGQWYAEVAATISALRQKAFAAIDAAKDKASIDTILQQAKQDADTALQDLLNRRP